ncbi:MAG: hypothetical protein QW757_03560 [Candidatus Woesearchaeota archaeon]
MFIKLEDYEKRENKLSRLEEALNKFAGQISIISSRMIDIEKRLSSLEKFKSEKIEKEMQEIKSIKDVSMKLLDETKKELAEIRKDFELQKAKEEIEEQMFLKSLQERLKK